MSLCYRCQHRVDCLEGSPAPRYECGDPKHSKYACYMFMPVKPVVLVKLDPSDERPQFGPPMIASRSEFVREVPEGEIELSTYRRAGEEEEVALYWRLKTVREYPKKGGEEKNDRSRENNGKSCQGEGADNPERDRGDPTSV